jgi:heat-inducible transcriptional repressor
VLKRGDVVLTERQTEILKLIVENYIQDAKPVGSKSICDTLNCSSATVRSEMSFLEDLGYLEKTHISSGRVPSTKGYRYYVDNIMQPKEISGEAVLKLQQIFKNDKLALTDTIAKSLELISELTHCTIISLGNSSLENCISKVEVIPVSEISVVAIIVTDKGYVENRCVTIDEKIDTLEMKQTVDLINKYIVGTPLEEVNAKLEFEVKPIIADSVNYQRKIFDAFCEFMNDVTDTSSHASEKAHLQVAGRNNILKNFDDVSKIRTILDKFEDKDFITNIKEKENGVNIYIGDESEFDEDVSIIKAKYDKDGVEGTIAIVGPKRMEYDRATTLLQYIIDNLDG